MIIWNQKDPMLSSTMIKWRLSFCETSLLWLPTWHWLTCQLGYSAFRSMAVPCCAHMNMIPTSTYVTDYILHTWSTWLLEYSLCDRFSKNSPLQQLLTNTAFLKFQTIHFIGIFHYKPFILGVSPIYGNPHIPEHHRVPHSRSPNPARRWRPGSVNGRLAVQQNRKFIWAFP